MAYTIFYPDHPRSHDVLIESETRQLVSFDSFKILVHVGSNLIIEKDVLFRLDICSLLVDGILLKDLGKEVLFVVVHPEGFCSSLSSLF